MGSRSSGSITFGSRKTRRIAERPLKRESEDAPKTVRVGGTGGSRVAFRGCSGWVYAHMGVTLVARSVKGLRADSLWSDR